MNSHPFSGVYKDFSSIPSSPWYNQDELLRRAAKNVVAARSQDIPFLGSKQLLSSVVAMLGSHVRILDFGGAAGLDFANLLSATNPRRTDLQYTVVDFAPACKVGSELWQGDDRISFATEMPAVHFDLIYSCSSLHYEQDYQSRIRSFTHANPKAILLLRHPIASIEFARQQHVASGSFPQWVMSLKKIEQALSNYRLAVKNYSEDQYDVTNYEPPYNVAGSMNLLFLRQ